MAKRGDFFKNAWINEVKRGWHNFSFDNTFTCNSGDLIPTKCLELFPGDVIHDSSSAMARLMPMVAPVMGKMNMFSYHFIARMRDIWTQWDKFITNYDQKRTWQQNQNFVPPSMPFIDIKEVLYGPIYLSASQPTNLAGFHNVFYLYQYHDTDGYHSMITTDVTHVVNLLNSSADSVRCFVIIPNKDDDFGFYQNGLGYYNPFCKGSLLEFLKCNIDGFFKSTARKYKNVYAGASAGLLNAYTDWSKYTDFVDTSTSSWIGIPPVNFTPTDEWMEDHMILDYMQKNNNGGLTATVNYFVDGRIVGTDFVPGVALSVAPFDPSNADQFDFEINALPLRAYRFIYDEYFRDENYIDVNPNTDFSRDGNDLDWLTNSYHVIWQYLTFCRKAFEHDLYTTALPSAQRGNPVRFLSDVNLKYNSPTDLTKVVKAGQGLPAVAGSVTIAQSGSNAYLRDSSNDWLSLQSTSAYVDLSAATIENLRFYNSMQRYLELKARTGGRYYEYMLGQWGHAIDDAKINRPIYLDGSKTPVQISEVTQTSASDVQTGQPLGDLAGRGVAIGEDHRIEFTSPDCGFLFELCCVVPRTSYGQGIAPMFKRFNYMDYPLPSFANLGEEPVKKRELFATLAKNQDDAAFGYQSRYYQFKYERDQIHGSMLGDLKHWNFARLFDATPYNGEQFLEVDPSYRQFAVTSKHYDHFLVTMWHDIQINRALPEHSIPSL